MLVSGSCVVVAGLRALSGEGVVEWSGLRQSSCIDTQLARGLAVAAWQHAWLCSGLGFPGTGSGNNDEVHHWVGSSVIKISARTLIAF